MESKKFLRIFVVVVMLVSTTSCNFFSSMSDKETDSAILFHIKSLINEGLYADAIARFGTLTLETQQLRSSQIILASAYAGRAGLNVIQLALDMGNNSDEGTRSFFGMLLYAFRGKGAPHFADILAAQEVLFNISTDATLRTIDENIFMVFIQFAKLGILFATLTDADGNGTVDASFNACTTTEIPDLFSNELIAAVGNILLSISAAGTSIAEDSLSGVKSACTQIETETGVNICSITDPNSTDIDGTYRQIARTLMVETYLGVGLQVFPNVREFNPPAPAGALCP